MHSGPGTGGRDQTSQTPMPEWEEGGRVGRGGEGRGGEGRGEERGGEGRGEGRGGEGRGGEGKGGWGETELEAIHQSGEYLEKFRFYF